MTAAQRATLEIVENAAREEKPYRLIVEYGYEQAGSVADALRAALGTCGSCQHYNNAEAAEMGWGHCAAPIGHPAPFRHRMMPTDERCKGWTAHDA